MAGHLAYLAYNLVSITHLRSNHSGTVNTKMLSAGWGSIGIPIKVRQQQLLFCCRF